MLKDFERILVSEEQITEICDRVAKQITEDYKDKNLVLLCILKGSIMFCAELMKKVELPVELEFFAVGNESADAELLAVCTFGR